MVTQNLDTCTAFKKLLAAPKDDIKAQFTAKRIATCQAEMGAGLMYNYAAKGVSDSTLSLLASLAKEQQVIAQYEALLNGDMMNTGEKRKVLHHLCRGQLLNNVEFQGRNCRDFYRTQQDRIATFAHKVHAGTIVGSTGKKFDTIVQIGIGGSDLGPRALYMALENLYPLHLKAYFISNVDPDDATAILSKINLETTLFIIVSKSGTTQETLTNYHFVVQQARHQQITGYQVEQHIVAVTSQTSPMAQNRSLLDAFFIDDFVGGRYSSTSAVGGTVLSLAFGPEVFADLLTGAHQADGLALQKDVLKNAALLDALIGVYERNILGYNSTAVLPYSQALSRFPAHLQQLDMESNGKSVNRAGQRVSYATGPIIFGEPGTNGQHSFYQFLHQGTDIIPLQFIGFCHSQTKHDVMYEESTSQVKLNANLVAQILAFVQGKDDADPNKNFAGGRPCSLIYGPKLTAQALGALLAHFENKVMFQGFLWNVNSFDQEGVQLGKVLTKQILHHKETPEGRAFMDLLDFPF